MTLPPGSDATSPSVPPSPEDEAPIAGLIFDDVPVAPPRPAPVVSAAPVSLAKPERAPTLNAAAAQAGTPALPIDRPVPPGPNPASMQMRPIAGPSHLGSLAPPVRQTTTAPAIQQRVYTSIFAGRDFRGSILPAMRVPWMGTGPLWLGVLAVGSVMGAAAALISQLTVIGAIIVPLGVLGTYLAMLARFFAACMAAAAHEFDDPGQLPDTSSFKVDIIMPGLVIALWWLVSTMPAIAFYFASDGVNLGVTVLAYGTVLLWPVALTVSSLRRKPLLALFDYGAMFRGLRAAPREWGVVYGLLVLVMVGWDVLSRVTGAMFGSWFGAALGLLLAGYLHGVAGALIGRLLVAYPEIGEAIGGDDAA